MAQKTKAQLTTEIGTTYPDNTVGSITPLGVRTYETDVLNSIMPTAPVVSGNLACFNGTTGLLKDCGTTLPSGLAAANLTLTTPTLGVAGATSLSIGGASNAGNVLAANGNMQINGDAIFNVANGFLVVGPNGTTNPAFEVNTPSSAGTGLLVQGAAGGSGVTLAAISAATNENFGINGKGSGSVQIGSVSTGGVALGSAGGGVTAYAPVTESGATSGTCANGWGENSSHQLILTTCPGAASSIQPGSTTITSGTNHSVLTTGTGTLSQAGPGTAGQALVSGGSGAEPSFKSGQWVLLNTLTANNTSVTLADTSSISATYTEYEVVLDQMLPASSSISLLFQFQVGGTFQTTSYLSSEGHSTGTAISQSNSTVGVLAGPAGNIISTGGGISGRYLLVNPGQTLTCKTMHGEYGYAFSGPLFVTGTAAGCYNGGSGAITGIQLATSSGNLVSGVMKIYGRVN